jgi:hypothetical protein
MGEKSGIPSQPPVLLHYARGVISPIVPSRAYYGSFLYPPAKPTEQ